MKIIKDGSVKPSTHTTNSQIYACDYCGAEIEIAKGDFNKQCPCCGSNAFFPKSGARIMVDAFPRGYYHYGASADSAHMTDDKIREMIDIAIKRYKLLGEGCAYVATGDTYVIVVPTDPEYRDRYEVVVCKDYYSRESPEC